MPRARNTADARPPSLLLFALEGPRAFTESLTLRPAARWLRSAPRGDGQPVLVLPGFTAGDASTRALRGYLKRQGFGVHPWLLGANLGLGGNLPERLAERVRELRERYDRKLSIVGWSLGGIYARELAKRLPDHVRQVVTLGSPFANTARPTNSSQLFAWFAGPERARDRRAMAEQLRVPPPVPSTAIYTRTDGVVHWSSCLEPETDHTENIAVPGSHCGLGMNPLALYAVADRLSQPEGRWQPFDRSGWRRRVYG